MVPKGVREALKIGPGTTLDWQVDGDAIRVVKLEAKREKSFLAALRRLGSFPAAPRDKRPVIFPEKA